MPAGPIAGVLAFGLNLIQLQTIFDKLPAAERLGHDAARPAGPRDGRAARDGERYVGSVHDRLTHGRAVRCRRSSVDGIDGFVGSAPVAAAPGR